MLTGEHLDLTIGFANGLVLGSIVPLMAGVEGVFVKQICLSIYLISISLTTLAFMWGEYRG